MSIPRQLGSQWNTIHFAKIYTLPLRSFTINHLTWTRNLLVELPKFFPKWSDWRTTRDWVEKFPKRNPKMLNVYSKFAWIYETIFTLLRIFLPVGYQQLGKTHMDGKSMEQAACKQIVKESGFALTSKYKFTRSQSMCQSISNTRQLWTVLRLNLKTS